MEAAANEKAPDAENRATQPAQQTKKRVDLGTKKCKKCSKGTSCHNPHDITCKKSQHYKPCMEAIAKMPPVESKAIFSRLSNRKPTSDPLKQGASGPMDAFVVPKATNSAKAPPAETSAEASDKISPRFAVLQAYDGESPQNYDSYCHERLE